MRDFWTLPLRSVMMVLILFWTFVKLAGLIVFWMWKYDNRTAADLLRARAEESMTYIRNNRRNNGC